jgi:hypothetical protein
MAQKDCAKIKHGSPHILIVLVLILIGCAEDYGRLVRDHEVNEIFKSYQILRDHRYYFSGPEGRPDAIMGIHPDYTLETTQWTEIDLTEGKLKKLIDWINFHHRNNSRNYPDGFLILDHNGRQVGIWYSIWDWTAVLVEADKRVWIFPPAMEEPFGDGGGQKRTKF